MMPEGAVEGKTQASRSVFQPREMRNARLVAGMAGRAYNGAGAAAIEECNDDRQG
jgi:hypothetical protein